MYQIEFLPAVASLSPLLLGIALLVSQRLIAGRLAPLRGDPVNLILLITGWALIWVGLSANFAGMFCIVAIGGGAMIFDVLFAGVRIFAPLGLVLPCMALFVLIETVRKHRAAQQYALLWLLTVSAERSMPLGTAVEAFARESGGRFGRRAERLAKMLNSGKTLPEALGRCPKLLPRHALPMVQIGGKCGALGSALRRAAEIRNIDEPVWIDLVGKIGYLSLLPIFGAGVLVFLWCKILPAYEKIFVDFGLKLPTLTQRLITATSAAINYWYLFAPVFIFLFPYVVLRYFGWIKWDLPGIARFARRLDGANILDGLALVARQERPMLDGLVELSGSYPKRGIRRRLRRAAEDVRSGRDWCESLYRRDLIRRADLAILQAAQRVGNLPWALREMAQSGRRRLAYRLQAIAQAAFPPVVILFGLAVLFIVAALFWPLVALIQRLS